MDALVDMLKASGAKTMAVIYVDDLFGLENYAALKVAVQGSGISIVEDKSYPFGVKDLGPVLRSMKDKSPDAFIGLTYPPDTILTAARGKEIGFNPKFFYAAVGTAFQLYRNVMQAGAEGVLGMGLVERQDLARREGLLRRHVKKFQKEPDRWASGACWAGLEIMTAAVAKAGLDRKAIRDYVASTEHSTIIGKIKFVGSENVGTPGSVSQWQKGEFEVVWPKPIATAALQAPKPPWA
jgi:branched-chain amino acid transport system substrate-binding protein